jgi:hypothetical protein
MGFTYISLRNEQTSLLATGTTRGAGGFLRRGSEFRRVVALEAGEPGPRRSLRVTLDGGEVLEGVAETVHAYSVPIYNGRRPGTNVVARLGSEKQGDERLGGIINHWIPR